MKSVNLIGQRGYHLLEFTINSTIGFVILAGLFYTVFVTLNIFNALQLEFDSQTAQLITKHYLTEDLVKNSYFSQGRIFSCKANIYSCLGLANGDIIELIRQKRIKPDSDILILQHVSYYLRESALPKENTQHAYALYRDDLEHKSQALVEGIIDWQLNLEQDSSGAQKLTLKILFKNRQALELNHN